MSDDVPADILGGGWPGDLLFSVLAAANAGMLYAGYQLSKAPVQLDRLVALYGTEILAVALAAGVAVGLIITVAHHVGDDDG